MIRNSRRAVALAIAGAVAVAPVISGCGAGSRPQSAAPTQLTEGVNASVPQGAATSQVDIRNMFLLGPRPDQALPAGSSLPLYGTIINQVEGRQDRLVSVTSPSFGSAQITGGAVTLPPARPSGEGTPVTLVGEAPQQPQPAQQQGRPGQPGQQQGQSGQQQGQQQGQATPTGRATPTPTREPGTPRSTTSPSPRPTTPSPGAAASRPADTATPTPPEGGATAQPSNAPIPPRGKVPLVVLSNLNLRQVLGGESIRVRLQFEHAGTIEILVPVVPQQNEYGSYVAVSTGIPAPGGSPTPSTPEGGTGGESGGHAPAPAGGGHN